MKLALFVHDFHLEIGHTNAMVEVLRHWQGDAIEELVVVAMTFSPIEKMLPELAPRVRIIQVWPNRLNPFLLKVIWYQVVTWVLSKTLLKNHLRIGIGTACLAVELVNVQFVHSQWQDEYLKLQNQSGKVRWYYKKILFAYLTWCERVLYRRPAVAFACCAQFISDFMQQNFSIPSAQVATAYSGINLKRFTLSGRSHEEIQHELACDFPQLALLDLSRPIALFVGAFERKGLPQVLKNRPAGFQLIVVGESELPGNIYNQFDNKLKSLYFIPHTKKISKFYELADAFVFPSLYDPFGLVVAEAAAMGLQVFVSKYKVGAAELLAGSDEVYLIDGSSGIDFKKIRKIEQAERQKLRQQRLEQLSKHSWSDAAKVFSQLIANNKKTK